MPLQTISPRAVAACSACAPTTSMPPPPRSTWSTAPAGHGQALPATDPAHRPDLRRTGQGAGLSSTAGPQPGKVGLKLQVVEGADTCCQSLPPSDGQPCWWSRLPSACDRRKTPRCCIRHLPQRVNNWLPDLQFNSVNCLARHLTKQLKKGDRSRKKALEKLVDDLTIHALFI